MVSFTLPTDSVFRGTDHHLVLHRTANYQQKSHVVPALVQNTFELQNGYILCLRVCARARVYV